MTAAARAARGRGGPGQPQRLYVPATAPAPLLVIGLDGGDWALLDRLCAAGWMPHLAALVGRGLRAPLRSTLPAATLPAWTSFLTGCAPAVHGVADMLVRLPGVPGLTPAGGMLRTRPTFLAALDRAGLAVLSLGFPGTYPPERLQRGAVVAGFDAPGAGAAGRAAVWPPALWPTLAAAGGWHYAAFNEQRRRGPAALARAARALVADVAAKEGQALRLIAARHWDLVCLHLQASDTAGHHLWHSADWDSPRHRRDLDPTLLPMVYARLDALVGRLFAAMPAGTRLLLVSDHGMGGASDVAVHLGRLCAEVARDLGLGPGPSTSRARAWLARGAVARALGHLSRGALTGAVGHLPRRALAGALGVLPRGTLGAALRHLPPAARAALWDAARGGADAGAPAFSDELDYAPSIWLGPGAPPALADTLISRLLALRHPRTGAALVEHVHRRDALPPGPHAGRLPDLVIEPAWPGGYRPSFLPAPGPGPIVRLLGSAEHGAPRGAGMPGVHRRDGILLAVGPGLAPGRLPTLDIDAAGAAVYALLGQPCPAHVDARLPAAWAAALGAGTGHAPEAARDARARSGAAEQPPAYTARERTAMLARLGAMGYL